MPAGQPVLHEKCEGLHVENVRMSRTWSDHALQTELALWSICPPTPLDGFAAAIRKAHQLSGQTPSKYMQ